MAWKGASASTWLRVGWFPSTLVWFEQSWASKLAAKARMAAWLSEAVNATMNAQKPKVLTTQAQPPSQLQTPNALTISVLDK